MALESVRGGYALVDRYTIPAEVLFGMINADYTGLAGPPPGVECAVRAKNMRMFVVGDSVLNLFPAGESIGHALTTERGYMNLTMVPVRCATFPTLILEICENIKGACT